MPCGQKKKKQKISNIVIKSIKTLKMVHIKKKNFKKREFVIHSFQDEGTLKKDHLEMPQG